jgi:hypothetical protein
MCAAQMSARSRFAPLNYSLPSVRFAISKAQTTTCVVSRRNWLRDTNNWTGGQAMQREVGSCASCRLTHLPAWNPVNFLLFADLFSLSDKSPLKIYNIQLFEY